MTSPTLPILDNHMHLNPSGRCLEAVREFARAGGVHPDWTLHEVCFQYGTDRSRQRVTGHLMRASKPRKEPLHVEISIMINSVMKYKEPQINTDERRFVNPALCSSVVLINTNRKGNYVFASFALSAVSEYLTPQSTQRAQSVHRDH